MGEFIALLKRKYGPAPLWVYLLVGVAALAWYLRSRNKGKDAAEEDTKNDSVLDQYALAYPMPYQGDVTVNVPSTAPAPTIPDATTPISTGIVKKGWGVNQWITDFRALPGGDPTLDWGRLEALNPGIANNVVWHKDSQLNTFKNDASYRVR